MRTSLVDRHAVERLLLLAGALRAGLIDALAAGSDMSAGEVARRADADLRATTIVLEALAGEDLVERTTSPGGDVLYRLSTLAKVHLVEPGPELERFGILHQAGKMRGWLDLPEVIRRGKPPEREGDRDLTLMVSAMGEREPAIVEEIVGRCLAYSRRVGTMLDVGGAVGHFARAFSSRGVKASLFDRDEVLPAARRFLGDEAAKIELIGGDLTVALPTGPFDLVYFGNVLHIYSEETVARVLREAFSVTSPGGTVAVQGYMWGRSPYAAMFAVNMLRSAGEGGVWSEDDYRGWLNEAGFTEVETYDLESQPAQLMLARRPN